jgi:hypothetical protein
MYVHPDRWFASSSTVDPVRQLRVRAHAHAAQLAATAPARRVWCAGADSDLLARLATSVIAPVWGAGDLEGAPSFRPDLVICAWSLRRARWGDDLVALRRAVPAGGRVVVVESWVPQGDLARRDAVAELCATFDALEWGVYEPLVGGGRYLLFHGA